MKIFRFRRRLAFKLLILIPIAYLAYITFSSASANEPGNPIYNSDASNNAEHSFGNQARELVREQFKNYEQIKANGKNGKALVIDESQLSADEKKKFDDGWQTNAFNRYASDLIPLNRTLPDVRLKSCNNDRYSFSAITVSVIICFHNEAWSVLLRSVYSLIDRTPPNLLKEILLVDDFSDQEHLMGRLDSYLKDAFNDKVRVLRNSKREGLIRTRLHGARVATGDVLVFLDSHIEATTGWIEPLVEEIYKNESVVVTPMIDIIDQKTFEYKYSQNDRVSVGGFDWNLQFTWHGLPEREYKLRKSDHDPVRSPTMAGGLFAISKNYFNKLGTYDAQMDIWGGENLEISFRIWMCGGTLLTVPCSHVGHIFRDRSPYKWMPGVNVLKKNSIRVAEVWLDDFKKIYYERINNDLGNFGDVSERRQLRERLQCKSFKWYIENIYPDLWVPSESIYSGAVSHQVKALSLASISASRRKIKDKPLVLESFKGKAVPLRAMWYYSKNSEIRRDDMCVDYPGGRSGRNKPDLVITYPCHGDKGNQEWRYNYKTDKLVMHVLSGLCMEVNSDNKLVMNICDSSSERQKWNWKPREA